jgi:hypothetical protein
MYKSFSATCAFSPYILSNKLFFPPRSNILFCHFVPREISAHIHNTVEYFVTESEVANALFFVTVRSNIPYYCLLSWLVEPSQDNRQ